MSVSRRNFLVNLGWGGVIAFLTGSLIATIRFFFPRVLFEPPSQFKAGIPSEYLEGVNTQYQDKHGILIVRREDGRFFCLSAKCTHLGCAASWEEAYQKFKCHCHGSGFYMNGDNFEGPAPRPLDRFKVSLTEDGQLLVDKGIIFKGVAGKSSDGLYPESLLSV